MRNTWTWSAAIAIVVVAAVFALWKSPPPHDNPFSAEPLTTLGGGGSESSGAIVPRNAPVVTGFVGDLLIRGNPEEDGTLQPFVVGETLKLEADAHNAVEYRW